MAPCNGHCRPSHVCLRTRTRGGWMGIRRRAAALVLAALGLTAAPASASDVSLSTAYVVNGSVNAVAIGGGFTYLGGLFTQAGPRIGEGMQLRQTGHGEPDTSTFPQ